MTNTQLLSFENLFKKSWELFSKGLSLFLAIQFIVMAATFVGVFLIVGLVFVGMFMFPILMSLVLAVGNSASQSWSIVILAVIASFILGLLILVAFLALFGLIIIGQIALILAINDVNRGQVKDYKEYFRLAWKKFWPAMGLFFLVGVMVGVGFIFLIIPGIILGFFLMFSTYVLVLENKNIVDSIKTSFQMVKDNLWDVVARYFLIYLAIIVVQVAGNFIPVLNIVVNIFVGIFAGIFVYLLYDDLKRIRKTV